MNKLKLDIEDFEELYEYLDQPGWQILLKKVLPQLLEREAQKVLFIRPDNAQEIHKLVAAQASYQGSRDIIKALTELKVMLRNQRT